MSAGEMPANFYYLAAQDSICISLEINIKYFAFNYLPGPELWQGSGTAAAAAAEIKTKLNFTVNKSLSPSRCNCNCTLRALFTETGQPVKRPRCHPGNPWNTWST